MAECPQQRDLKWNPSGSGPPSPRWRKWAPKGLLAGALLMMGMAWGMGPTHVLILGLPFGIVALTVVLLGDRWWALSPRHQAMGACAMAAVIAIPDIAAVNHLGWHDRLYATEWLAWLGLFTALHFGIAEGRRKVSDSNQQGAGVEGGDA